MYIMKGFTEACRVYVLFLAVALFFGQLYFSEFSLGSTMAGVAGLVVGGMAAKLIQENTSGAVVVTGVFAIGLIGIGIDAFEYYSKHNIPGNDFGWLLKGPYIIALSFLTIPAVTRLIR